MKNGKIFWLLASCSALLFLAGCGGGNGTTLPPNQIASSAANVAAIQVNTGPTQASGVEYANGAFVSVTVCVPGTSTCQTIPDVLVDTGSYGLRIVSSVLTITLPQETASDGNPMAECVGFLDSYTWGPVQTGDVEVAGEKASSVPIQVLSDTDYTAPTSCSDKAPGASADTVANLGTYGIIGVGQLPQDCGSNVTCSTTTGQYYSCPSTTTCAPIAATAAQQVANPVALFPTDNNGVIIELPAVSGAAATVSGSLVFGIGTESNNSLNGATVYEADSANLNFSTSFNGADYSDAAFIDSGSNAYFFPDASIPACSASSGASAFYCPNGTENLSATNTGTNGTSGTVNFSIANAVTMFTNDPNDAAYAQLGGGASGYFDWGLPFFYGRNVFTAIEGKTAPGGTPPYWAY